MSIDSQRPRTPGQQHAPVKILPIPATHQKNIRHWKGGTGTLLTILTLLTLFTLIMVIGENIWEWVPLKKAPITTVVSLIHRSTGQFVLPPLTPQQINALRHRRARISYQRMAQMYVSHMTLDEELGQLFMAEYYDNTYSPALDTMLNQLHAGGVVMYAFQMNTLAQTKHDISKMQHRAKTPLLISADEEGGFVERVQHIYGHRPGALEIYQTGQPHKAAQAGQQIAHDLRALGINLDLAPDVDVQLVNGPDQYLRTWGYTPQSVITYAGAYLRAVQGNGVLACIKHFPGLGAAQTDAHFDLPIIARSKEQLHAVELAPFKAFIQSHNPLEQPAMVMSTDVLMPAIDPIWPAELSHTFISDILRKELGYDGVVITDALYMKGIANHWGLSEAGVLALNAGNDMLLGANGPTQMQDMLNGLKSALQNGRLSKARIDEAATRIIRLKLRSSMM